MSFRRSWKRRMRSRRMFGKRPRSYKAFFGRRRRRVSRSTPFHSRGGILR